MQKKESKGIPVRKASGELEHFDSSKLRRSLQNAGADTSAIEEITANIENWLHEGVTTKKIYSRAFSLLFRKNRINALYYKLKQALIELGPTGYPFEQFVGEIYKKQGYTVEVGQILEGHCITHEMDVIATNKTTQWLIECKYAKDQGKIVSIQVPLYVRSRIDDIIKKRNERPEFKHLTFSGGIVTNTRFSTDSIEYSRCSGLKLLAWDYPEGNGLKDIIGRENIFPISVLTYLTKKEKEFLMDKNIVTCKQLQENIKILDELALNKKKTSDLMRELEDICNDTAL
ncbi:MAG: restriction endonuclease [Bacteroidales bacterium]|nr:restriction endonuclease [Bacteroidales bacterium]